MAWYDNRPDGRTPDTHVVYCVRGPFCFGYGFGPAEAFAHALRELPSFVKSQARERKLPIKWECFEVDPGCEFELYDTGTAHWSPAAGARRRNHLLIGLMPRGHMIAD